MSRLRLALTLALACAACIPMAAQAQADKATINALEGYFDFVDANAGTILPEQIPAEDYKKFHVIDVRDAAQFAKEHVPGAANIEWRCAWTASRTCACCMAASTNGRRAVAWKPTRERAGRAERWAIRRSPRALWLLSRI